MKNRWMRIKMGQTNFYKRMEHLLNSWPRLNLIRPIRLMIKHNLCIRKLWVKTFRQTIQSLETNSFSVYIELIQLWSSQPNCINQLSNKFRRWINKFTKCMSNINCPNSQIQLTTNSITINSSKTTNTLSLKTFKDKIKMPPLKSINLFQWAVSHKCNHTPFNHLFHLIKPYLPRSHHLRYNT